MSAEEQNRFTSNASSFTRGSLDIGLNWKFNKYLKVSADYVFIEKRKNEGNFAPRNWGNVAVHLRKELRRWKFFYRGMLQARTGDLFTNKQYEYRIYNREKINIRYELTKHLGFYVADEIYIPLNSPRTKGIDRNRSYLGMVYKLAKNHQLEFYFLYQQQVQKNYWFKDRDSYDNSLMRRYYVYGIGYAISIQ